MKPRVVYLGLSLELYRQTSKPNLPIWENAFRNWKNELSAVADIVASRVCYTDADVAAASADVEALKPDAIVLSAVSYTPSMLIYPSLKKWGVPVVIWSTQDSSIIPDDFVPEDLTNNHTVQGIQDLTNVMFQNSLPFSIVTSHWTDSARLQKVGAELRAIKAAKAARNMKVLSLGGSFAGMGDFEYDAEEVRRLWGPVNTDIGAAEFLEALKNIDNGRAEKIRESDLEKYDVSSELKKETHLESIRRKLAIKALLEKYGATAFTMNFTALVNYQGFGQLPFYGINTLMAEGIGYAGEGDVLRAALMRQMVELAGAANFTEIYNVDFRRNRMFMSHMQECNPAMAQKSQKVELVQMPFWVKGSPDYCGMKFTLEPGEYTLVSMTHTPNGKFRFIAFTGTVPANVPFFEHYDRAYWLLEPQCPVEELLDRYSVYGGAHHLSAMSGNELPALQSLAKHLNFEFVDIS